MKSYLSLIPISARVHKRQHKMTLICIVLAVFLVTAIFSMAEMELRSQKIKAIKDYGNWHVMLKNITAADAELVKRRPDVAASSWYHTLNFRLMDAYYINEKAVAICGTEEALISDILTDSIAEGSYPANDHQVMLTDNTKNSLGLSLGDAVTLENPSRKPMSFTISGFIKSTSVAARADAIVLICNIPGFEKIYETAVNKGLTNADMAYYVQFSERCNIRKSIAQVKEAYGFGDDDISQNTALLGVMGMSDDSYMLGMYLTAVVLFLLVLTAGVLMITSSLNSNISQRTEFFGMMRCIGADKKQIIRFVRLEALNWCKKAIPVGVVLAIALTWLLCGLLRMLSPQYFSDMPVLGVSWTGILAGIIVGILTVLLAAQAPAKKAAGVSPLTAVSGNAGSFQKIKKAANTKFCKIETALGVHHAKTNKKNLFLMTGSFALSIVLFLAFSGVMSFMNHAIKPLKPYTPDLSVISPDNSCSIDKDLVTQLYGGYGIKRIYGRSFSYGVPAKFHEKENQVNLISYESNQFNWADEEDYVIEGDLAKVLGDSNYVLAVYHENNPLKVGDKIRLLETEVVVGGILSTSPFNQEAGVTDLICSEETFQRLTGINGYTIVDIQLTSKATEEEVNAIRSIAGEGVLFSDRRISNREAVGSYLSMALFIYGFLSVIAMITIFNIINSISMSVSARLRQYGAMKAVGMSTDQLIKMIGAQALTYAVFGCTAGCLLGLPVHYFLWNKMITAHWGEAWQVPLSALAIIAGLVVAACLLSVYGPAKRIEKMSVAEGIF